MTPEAPNALQQSRLPTFARISADVQADQCALEPIHQPQAIQPHGYFFCLREPGLEIELLSENALELLARPAASLLGSSLLDLLTREAGDCLRAACSGVDLRATNPLPLAFAGALAGRVFDGIVHRAAAGLIVELEPAAASEELAFLPFYNQAEAAMAPLSSADSLRAAAAATAAHVQRLTGFDRVLVYRFDPQWNGEVIAEARGERLESYLGLHFPATDIPVQARRLYALNWLRLIVDVDYRPSKLIGAAPDAAPIDMSFATLRSISPVHRRYMKNMGTAASMSVSIMQGERLWGLISCHHHEPRYASYQVRSACTFIGQLFSFQLAAIASREEAAKRQQLADLSLKLEAQLRRDGLAAGLCGGEVQLAALAAAQGGALVQQGSVTTCGQTPPADWILALVQWLRDGDGGAAYSAYDELAAVYPPALAHLATAAGLLATAVTKSRDTYLLWFRPELIRTVSWAGAPERGAARRDQPAPLHLHPRTSFELWKEVVPNKARSWDQAEIAAALDLRNRVVVEALARANADLEASNRELDAFTYVASHDLKEPLRGMRTYLGFVLDDCRQLLPDTALQRLTTVNALAKHLDNMLSSLYSFSKVGRLDLALGAVDLGAVLAEVLLRLSALLQEQNVGVEVPEALPTVRCDRVRIGEVFYNLIANAIKYNDKDLKRVAIGTELRRAPAAKRQQLCFYVRDNGIGVAPQHHQAIFTMFNRLHGQNGRYGDGSGAGLTIAKRIVERHQGQLWVESELGAGATFYFTLGPE